VLANDYRGSGPYLGISYLGMAGWGNVARPGAATSVAMNDRSLVLKGVPLGKEPVTVDWSFCFDERTFDQTMRWKVSAPIANPVWEVGWGLDTMLPRQGDPLDLNRRGDVSSFAPWTIAYDDRLSLVTAYKDRSSWRTDNRWFSAERGTTSWQALWRGGGTDWAPGEYAGGTWRTGASGKSGDRAYADQVAAALNGGPSSCP
jgi:hypothetical protein